jgi:hypothetical protein
MIYLSIISYGKILDQYFYVSDIFMQFFRNFF